MNRKLIATLFAIIAFGNMAVAQTKFDETGLVGRWTMRNTGGTLVEDSSDKGNFGFLQGNAFFKDDPTLSTSVQIVDLSGKVSVAHSSDLEPARGTVETFVKVDYLQFADILHKVTLKTLRTNRRDGVGGAVYGIRMFEDGNVQGFVLNDDPKQKSQWTIVQTLHAVIKPGSWHHLALQWDGQFVRLFVDGTVVAKKKYNEIPGIGLSYGGDMEFTLAPGANFVGQFGETRIYSRPLTETELQVRATMPASK